MTRILGQRRILRDEEDLKVDHRLKTRPGDGKATVGPKTLDGTVPRHTADLPLTSARDRLAANRAIC